MIYNKNYKNILYLNKIKYSKNILFTQNKKNIIINNYNKLYKIIKENNKLKLKEYNGVIFKIKHYTNLTKFNFISLKKYNNIIYTLFKESPNLLIN